MEALVITTFAAKLDRESECGGESNERAQAQLPRFSAVPTSANSSRPSVACVSVVYSWAHTHQVNPAPDNYSTRTCCSTDY